MRTPIPTIISMISPFSTVRQYFLPAQPLFQDSPSGHEPSSLPSVKALSSFYHKNALQHGLNQFFFLHLKRQWMSVSSSSPLTNSRTGSTLLSLQQSIGKGHNFGNRRTKKQHRRKSVPCIGFPCHTLNCDMITLITCRPPDLP